MRRVLSVVRDVRLPNFSVIGSAFRHLWSLHHLFLCMRYQPFGPYLEYQLARSGNISLSLTNMQGQEQWYMDMGVQAEGHHKYPLHLDEQQPQMVHLQ